MEPRERAAQKPIDREAFKTLAIAIGVREAARQSNIPENTALSWAYRGKWFETDPKPLPPTITNPNGSNHAISAIKPSVALKRLQETRKNKVKTNLSEYLVNASKVAKRSRSPLKDSQDVKNVASVMAALWPEKEEESAGVIPKLSVYSEQTIINVSGNTGPQSE